MLDIKKIVVNGWILAAIILLAYNGCALIRFLYPPPTAPPQRLKAAEQKRAALNKLQQSTFKNLDLQDTKRIERAFSQIRAETITPPRLSGILEAFDQNGRVSFAALINGRLVREQDTFYGFFVKSVSPSGVKLSKAGQEFFLARPKAHDSTQNGGHQ